jgi:hypothetical protein
MKRHHDGSETKMEPLKILRSEIPASAYGRHLTPYELKAIRAAGHSVSDGAIVQRIPYLGIVYNPGPDGYLHSGMLVECT